MNDKKKCDELRNELTKAVTAVMAQNPLDNDQQMTALSDAFLNVTRLYGEMSGKEFPRFLIEQLENMIATVDPEYAEMQNLAMEMYLECEGEAQAEAQRRAPMQPRRNEGSAKRRGGRLPIDDPENSWLNVFPVPLAADKMFGYLMLRMGGEDNFDPKLLPSKMQGVLLTSMPEGDRKYIKQRMKELGLVAVTKAEDHRLRYVVFGAGQQASTKTDVIRNRIEHNEIIEGIYFEHFMDVLDELADMTELYDADQYAKQAPADYDPTMEDRERIANENGDTIDDLPPRAGSGQDGDDLPF